MTTRLPSGNVMCPGHSGVHVYTESGRKIACEVCGKVYDVVPGQVDAGHIPVHDVTETPTPVGGHVFRYHSAESDVIQTVIVRYTYESALPVDQGGSVGACHPADDTHPAAGWYIEFLYPHGRGGSYRTFVAFDKAAAS